MSHNNNPAPLPLVVCFNCIEDCAFEQQSLAGVATVDYVPLSRLSQGKIEYASVVLLHSLSYLPRAAQRRLRPYHLILCLGSADRSVDSALANDLGLRLVHVDTSRAEEVADTVMALFLGLLRRTHLLSRHALSASGWLGSVQPLCRGMRRCRGLVLGIVGRSASARFLATRSLAFKMSVLYFDVQEGQGKSGGSSINFPPAARRMDTLNDLLAASDLISLHCALTNETIQIINAECLQHVKPGAFLVNTGSSQLLDDCAVKQLLIDGTLAGCALDGAEGPQWMEAWVKEVPNVLILPRSADYSEEVWMEIRDKAIAILQAYFNDGIIPEHAVSDEDEEESEVGDENDQSDQQDRENALQICIREQTDDILISPESSPEKGANQVKELSTPHQASGLTQSTTARSEGRRIRSGKKAKKRHTRQKSQQKPQDASALEKESTSQREDDTAMSGTDQALSVSSRGASPVDSRSRKTPIESLQESTSNQLLNSSVGLSGKCNELLRDGYVIALYARDHSGFHVARQRGQGGGWFLDSMSNVSKRDPATQFQITFRSKDTIGLRSLAAGGKLLQINRRMEFVFASHSFDVWENWQLEGSLQECRMVNSRNSSAKMESLAGLIRPIDCVMCSAYSSSGAFRSVLDDPVYHSSVQGFYFFDPMNMGIPGINHIPPTAAAAASSATPTAAAVVNTASYADDPNKKIRKPYTITKSRESWSEQEHDKFLEALQLFDRDWKKIEAFVGSKTVIQIRSHAQKYFLKVQKNGTSEHVPPPRPKRKAAHPYPQKAPKNAPSVSQVTGSMQSSSAFVEPAYIYRPDSSSVLGTPVTNVPLSSWSYNAMPPASMPQVTKDDMGLAGQAVPLNCCYSSSNESTPQARPKSKGIDQVNRGKPIKVLPDFAQVYRFIGSLFDPNATNHLRRLKQMDPINVETVLSLMRNLSINLVSPKFKDYRRMLSLYDVDSEKAKTSSLCSDSLTDDEDLGCFGHFLEAILYSLLSFAVFGCYIVELNSRICFIFTTTSILEFCSNSNDEREGRTQLVHYLVDGKEDGACFLELDDLEESHDEPCPLKPSVSYKSYYEEDENPID
ncbi:C-terminal binding protein AN [Senna tora]|uniref:C-terminal binding protein AN n=1 Tax=Senna tora TaxID=362788 RepID=A0A834TQ38_9FABA|nr:C-terminal binding protein AN [Senna tora]